MNRDSGKTVHLLFDISVIGKAVNGALEIVGGIMLFFVKPEQINWLLRSLTQGELSEDPHDFVASLLVHSLKDLSTDTRLFAALFLVWHGVVKVGLVVTLLRKLRWAYPTAIIAFAVFLAYQLYRYSHTHSVWLLALSVLDLAVIVLTWLEYKRLRSSHEFRTSW